MYRITSSAPARFARCHGQLMLKLKVERNSSSVWTDDAVTVYLCRECGKWRIGLWSLLGGGPLDMAGVEQAILTA
jgi:hypothetical protein